MSQYTFISGHSSVVLTEEDSGDIVVYETEEEARANVEEARKEFGNSPFRLVELHSIERYNG